MSKRPARATWGFQMNATFDRQAALRLFRLLKKGRGPNARSLRVTVLEEYIIFESGAGLVSLPALVLESGAFTTSRTQFERILGSFGGKDTLTIQADTARFRIGAFSNPILDYESSPARPADFEPPAASN